MSGVGLLNEKHLHASLKEWYAQPGDQFEVPVDGFVIDIVRGELLLEIQTGGFASIKSKLSELVLTHQVRLIYPIAQEKWIIKQPKGKSDEVTRRKSPTRGRMEDLFGEMVSFPGLFTNPNFSLEILLIKEEEVRQYEEKRNWRRKGWSTAERRLLEVFDRRVLEQAEDLMVFLPQKEGESFTTADLVESMGIDRRLAQQMAYCLRKIGMIELTGKKGRANLYKIADSQ